MPVELPNDCELLNSALCVHSSSGLGEITNTHLSVSLQELVGGVVVVVVGFNRRDTRGRKQTSNATDNPPKP